MSKFDDVLCREEMERPRSPKELCDWVDSTTHALCETAEGRRYARFGGQLPKKLWEEVRPFGRFALHLFSASRGVKCIPNLGYDNFDGRIQFESGSTPTIYVELTYAKDGYDESLRFEVLDEHGSVNALGEISVSGTRASGKRQITVENEALEHDAVRQKALHLVESRIRKKAEGVYGSRHALVVVVDDYIPFREEHDRALLEERAKQLVTSTVLDFGAVFLLGSSGNYLCRIHGEI